MPVLTGDRARIRLISARRPTRGSQEPRGTAMKPDYDFSKSERGKFFRPNAELRLPIYLNADVQTYLAERADQKGIPPGEMVSMLPKQEIQIIESIK
jgi:hypothetical protein